MTAALADILLQPHEEPRVSISLLTTCSQIPDPQKTEITNIYCFKLVTLGLNYYTALDNQYTSLNRVSIYLPPKGS